MKYLLAHDLGTSGDKATLFSEDGTLLGSKVASYKVYYFMRALMAISSPTQCLLPTSRAGSPGRPQP